MQRIAVLAQPKPVGLFIVAFAPILGKKASADLQLVNIFLSHFLQQQCIETCWIILDFFRFHWSLKLLNTWEAIVPVIYMFDCYMFIFVNISGKHYNKGYTSDQQRWACRISGFRV